MTHDLFECPRDNEIRDKWIKLITQQWNNSPPDILVTKYLIDSKLEIILLLTKFLILATKTQKAC